MSSSQPNRAVPGANPPPADDRYEDNGDMAYLPADHHLLA